MTPQCSDADFIRLFEEIGPVELAGKLERNFSNIMRRRRSLEKKYGRPISSPRQNMKASHEIFQAPNIPGRLSLAVHNGVVLIGSDLHAWPGKPSTAVRAFVHFIKEFEPKAVVLNGDVIDGSSISRHPPLGWEKQPTLIEELEAAQQALHMIETASPKKAELIWAAGNHDARFSTRLATHAPEFARVHGTQLKDHFGERWKPCWSLWINDGEAVIKHRFPKNGVHASYNNTLHGGVTTVGGHLHSLNVIPFTDYNRTRWGVNCGMLADPYSYAGQFNYLEDGYRNWRSGFALLTFKDSELLWPELVSARDANTVDFRGKLIRV